ncbi:MAG: hypothetical protein B7Y02_09800 [Rhodobacterales bacterium 17-64-5]|nr:MAG: hypothetical protein B7Y02_09800 [Rhodobacterales bacterium 17-64-5]
MTMPFPIASRLVAASLLATSPVAALAQATPGNAPGRAAMLVEMFDEIDADADGLVTEAELAAYQAAEFAAADTNSDGTLSADEIAARQLARAAAKAADRAARMIDARDTDGDGVLSAAEAGEGPAQRHFARLDADADGALSKAEVASMVKELKRRRQHMQDDWN